MASARVEHPRLLLSDALETTIQNLAIADDAIASPTVSIQDSIHTTSSGDSEAQKAKWDEEDCQAEELFSHQVEKLCQTLWPPPNSMTHPFSTSQVATRLRACKFFQYFVPAPQTPLIKRLVGGDLNHITSITLPSSYPPEVRNLILRVPRWSQKRLDREVATLDWVRHTTSIPVPTVAATDFSCNNPFEKPYVLQHRIPGVDLNTIWDELSHSQRCTIAAELGLIIRTLLSVETQVSGVIEPVPAYTANTDSSSIFAFELDTDLDELPEETKQEILFDPRTPQTALDVFKFQFGRWRTVALAQSLGEIDHEVKLWDSMLKAVHEMDDLGLFEANQNCLCHVDLHPGNIMVKTGSDMSIEITAILDWDEAIFAPKFVNCHPPGWIWGYEYMDRNDEDDLLPWPYELEGANDLPDTPEKQELKRIFEEHAGPEFQSLAYDEHSRLCRGLFRIAKEGLASSSHWKAAKRTLKEWQILRQSLIKELQEKEKAQSIRSALRDFSTTKLASSSNFN